MSEHALQKTVTQFLALAMPAGAPWSAIDHAAKLSPRQAGGRKARGVVRGLPDYLFVLPPTGRVAFVELKVVGGYLSPEQKVWRDATLAAGALHAVARSLDEVIDALEDWGLSLRGGRRVTPKTKATNLQDQG